MPKAQPPQLHSLYEQIIDYFYKKIFRNAYAKHTLSDEDARKKMQDLHLYEVLRLDKRVLLFSFILGEHLSKLFFESLFSEEHTISMKDFINRIASLEVHPVQKLDLYKTLGLNGKNIHIFDRALLLRLICDLGAKNRLPDFLKHISRAELAQYYATYSDLDVEDVLEDLMTNRLQHYKVIFNTNEQYIEVMKELLKVDHVIEILEQMFHTKLSDENRKWNQCFAATRRNLWLRSIFNFH